MRVLGRRHRDGVPQMVWHANGFAAPYRRPRLALAMRPLVTDVSDSQCPLKALAGRSPVALPPQYRHRPLTPSCFLSSAWGAGRQISHWQAVAAPSASTSTRRGSCQPVVHPLDAPQRVAVDVE